MAIWRWLGVQLLAYVVLTSCVWPGPFELDGINTFGSLVALPVLAFSVLAMVSSGVYYSAKAFLNFTSGKPAIANVRQLVACLGIAIFGCTALWSLKGIRHAAFERAAARGNQVVASIAQYRADHGEYPESLDRLVPNYLQRVPHTGLAGYPNYYYVRQGDPSWHIDGVADYEIGIHCPWGFLNWDLFFYWPNGDYPGHIYGGGVERINGWAYVHE